MELQKQQRDELVRVLMVDMKIARMHALEVFTELKHTDDNSAQLLALAQSAREMSKSLKRPTTIPEAFSILRLLRRTYELMADICERIAHWKSTKEVTCRRQLQADCDEMNDLLDDLLVAIQSLGAKYSVDRSEI